VAYIDDDDEDDPSMPLYQTMPYACGKVLLASVLDSLVAAVCTIHVLLVTCAPDMLRSGIVFGGVCVRVCLCDCTLTISKTSDRKLM